MVLQKSRKLSSFSMEFLKYLLLLLFPPMLPLLFPLLGVMWSGVTASVSVSSTSSPRGFRAALLGFMCTSGVLGASEGVLGGVFGRELLGLNRLDVVVYSVFWSLLLSVSLSCASIASAVTFSILSQPGFEGNYIIPKIGYCLLIACCYFD